jgi:beta-1,4-mannosyl-glycoprotein beta-1,4-N-acetylglucosaminyltransferase
MLKYHLEVLYDHVDHFVITESRQTHMGHPKPLFLKENAAMFAKYLHKIVWVVVDLPHLHPVNVEKKEQWLNENFQRNMLTVGLDSLNLKPDDIIISCDLDEITNPDIINKFRILNTSKPDYNLNYNLIYDMYFHNLNTKCTDRWALPKLVSYGIYKNSNISLHRLRYNNMNDLKNSGWHLSNFGDAEFIRNKLENYTHQEHNYEECKNLSTIQAKIDAGISVFLKEGEKQNTIQLSIKDNPFPPPRLDLLQEFIKF